MEKLKKHKLVVIILCVAWVGFTFFAFASSSSIDKNLTSNAPHLEFAEVDKLLTADRPRMMHAKRAAMMSESVPRGGGGGGGDGASYDQLEADYTESAASASDGDAGSRSDVSSTAKRTQRMLIRDANIRLTVMDVGVVVTKLERLVERYDGFIAEANVFERNADLTVRVPSAKLDEFIRVFKQINDTTGLIVRVESESMKTEDATDRYYDMDTRITTLRASHAQMLLVMTNATKIPDILAVQQQLNQISEELERVTSQFRRLGDRVALSTLSISLNQQFIPPPPPTPPDIWKIDLSITSNFQRGCRILQYYCVAFLNLIALAAAFLLPVVVLAILICLK